MPRFSSRVWLARKDAPKAEADRATDWTAWRQAGVARLSTFRVRARNTGLPAISGGVIARGTLGAITAGVSQGGMIAPVVSHRVVHGGGWHRRVHNLHDVRWVDDFIATATWTCKRLRGFGPRSCDRKTGDALSADR